MIKDLHRDFEQAVSVVTCPYYAPCTHGPPELQTAANRRRGSTCDRSFQAPKKRDYSRLRRSEIH